MVVQVQEPSDTGSYMTSANDDIRLPRHGEPVPEPFRAFLLPRGVKAIDVSGQLIFARWGLRGWSQLPPEEDRAIRDRLGIK